MRGIWITVREQQILRCYAEGMTERAIARALKVSRFTVHNECQMLNRKLRARSRVEAIVKAVSYGVPLTADLLRQPNERRVLMATVRRRYYPSRWKSIEEAGKAQEEVNSDGGSLG